MRSLIRLAVAFLFLAALPLAAQTGKWTAVASTGDIDESSENDYAVSGPALHHQVGFTKDVIARYNVTNTWGGGADDTPPWAQMQLGYGDNSPAGWVKATLFRVDPCTGFTVPVCTITSIDNQNCGTCFVGAIDFANKLYFVEVTVHRDDTTAAPAARTLRIF
jgi:hypothetical protein